MTTERWQNAAGRLSADSIRDGSPTRWFDELYQAGATGATTMPWPRQEPHPLLVQWWSDWSARPAATGPGVAGPGADRTVVVGSGLGADAEFVGARAVHTLAFDISGTAIELTRQRFPDSTVDYRQADLFDLPADWRGRFGLVIENITVQAMPRSVRSAAIAAVRELVAPGGTLLVISSALADGDDPEDGPPWPLTRADVEAFAEADLQSVRIEQLTDPRSWRAEFRRAID